MGARRGPGRGEKQFILFVILVCNKKRKEAILFSLASFLFSINFLICRFERKLYFI